MSEPNDGKTRSPSSSPGSPSPGSSSPKTVKARVHCERCDKESDAELVAGQTNTGKAYLQGACPHCGAPVYALSG